jgi:hypothetical protein
MQKNSQMFMFGDAYGKALDDMNQGIVGLDQATQNAIMRDNLREAILRNVNLDTQGDVRTFDIPEEEEDDLMNYDDLMESDTTSSKGILDILKMLGQGALGFATDIPFIGQGITGLANMLGDTFRGSRFYNPRTASGNRLFAPGSRAGDPFNLNMRRDASRISRMLQRGAAGKNFSQKNLDNVLGKFGITGVDTGGMMDSIAESAQTGYGGYGSSEAAAEAAASGGRDYSSSPGAMAGDMEYGEE